MNYYERIYEAIINEIGDSPKGKEFIRKAYDKRDKQHDTAVKAGAKAYKKDPPPNVDSFRVERAKLQMQRVAQYMNKRMEHEKAAEESPENVARYLASRKAMKKHPRVVDKRDKAWTPPKTPKDLKKDMGDWGARVGTQSYKDEYGEAEKKTRKTLKKLGGNEPTGRGLKKAIKTAQARDPKRN